MRPLSPFASVLLAGLVVCAAAPGASAGADHLLGDGLAPSWIVASPGEADWVVEDGWLHVDVPGQHLLGGFAGDAQRGPMFLIAPRADAATVTFQTRLRSLDDAETPEWAQAGLVLARRDMVAGVLFGAARSRRMLRGEWWWEDSAIYGFGSEAFRDADDIWLKFEHRGDRFHLFRKGSEEDPWEDVTADMPDNLSNIARFFPPGAFLVGMFVTSGWGLQDDVEVAFDYFSSPEVIALGVEAAGKAAIAWGTVKQDLR